MRGWPGVGLAIVAAACGADPNTDPGPATGAIRVVTEARGSPLDTDGYSLSLDGGPALVLAPADTVVFLDVPAGDHLLTLSGVSADCRVDGGNPRTVRLVAGQTAHTIFALFCGLPGTGRLTVSTFTYGSRPPFYVLRLADGPTATIGPEDRVTIGSLTAGLHTLTLTNVPSSCDVASSNPRLVQVPVGGEKVTLFKIRCPE